MFNLNFILKTSYFIYSLSLCVVIYPVDCHLLACFFR